MDINLFMLVFLKKLMVIIKIKKDLKYLYNMSVKIINYIKKM